MILNLLCALLITIGLMATDSRASVWMHKGHDTAGPVQITQTYQLNGATLHFESGQTRQDLTGLKKTFQAQARRAGQRFFFHILANYALGCQVDPHPNITLETVAGTCLFAQQKNGQITFQRVSTRGMPRIQSTKLTHFESVTLDLDPKDRLLHLTRPQDQGLALLSIHKAPSPRAYASQLKDGLIGTGWQEIQFKNRRVQTFFKGNRMVVTQETERHFLAYSNKMGVQND